MKDFFSSPARFSLLVLAALAITAFALPSRVGALPDPVVDETPAPGVASETIVLSGGCFWGVEAVFEHLKGVTNVESGYAGGDASTANYKAVTTGTTGHAESVRVTYDPTKITLGTLLKVFFSVAHDPTQLNYQGPDRGTQYRSAVFVADSEQKKIVEDYIAQLEAGGIFPEPIVTKVDDLETFYPAEEYHQDFMRRNPLHPYIMRHDAPKLAALEKTYPALYTPGK